MKKLFKNATALALFASISLNLGVSAFASDEIPTDKSGFSPIEAYELQLQHEGDDIITRSSSGELKVDQSKDYIIPGGKGTLTSNAWRSGENPSGNTLQWDYQVSAYYTGNEFAETIRTTWQGSAQLRSSANMNLGVSESGVTAGGGSSWGTYNTPTKYWENTNGTKESSYRSNMVVTPAIDYRSGTISITNTATVKLRNDAKPYTISASV